MALDRSTRALDQRAPGRASPEGATPHFSRKLRMPTANWRTVTWAGARRIIPKQPEPDPADTGDHVSRAVHAITYPSSPAHPHPDFYPSMAIGVEELVGGVTARSFDRAAGDYIVMAKGGLVGTGAVTFAALIRWAGGTGQHTIHNLSHSADGGQGGLSLVDDGGMVPRFDGSTGATWDTGLVVPADQWAWVVVTHAAGSSAGTMHRLVLGSSWGHGVGWQAVGNIAAWDESVVAAWGAVSDQFDGEIAVMAAWDRVLSQTEIETLDDGLATQAAADLSPKVLWDFDQASVATAVPDLSSTGTADQTGIGGTAVSSGGPAGWTYGVSGAPVYEDGAVTLAGVASLTTVGRRTRKSSTTLAGAATLTTVGRRTRVGAVLAAGAGTLSVAASRARRGASALPAAGTLTVAGTVVGVSFENGVVTLPGVSTLAVAGRRTRQAQPAALSGVGTLASSASRLRRGATVLTSTGTLAATGRRVTQSVVLFAGAGTLAVSGGRLRAGSATLAGVVTMTATTRLDPPIYIFTPVGWIRLATEVTDAEPTGWVRLKVI